MKCLRIMVGAATVAAAAFSVTADADSGFEPPATYGGVLVTPIVVDLGKDYVSKKAGEKRAELLKLITGTKYAAGQLPNFPEHDLVATVAKKAMMARRLLEKPGYLNYMMVADEDVLSSTREKLTHRRGVAGMVRFEPTKSNGMTGMFSVPVDGLVRLSLTVPFPDGREPFGPALCPSMGLKFFVDGKASVNLVALHAVDGPVNVNDHRSDTHAFFAPDLRTTFAPKPTTGGGKLLKLAIDRDFTGDDWNRLSLVTLVSERADGTVESSPMREPHHLVFRAPKRDLVAADSPDDFRVALMSKVKAGVTLYDVYAVTDVKKAEKLIGHISMTTDVYASEVGDRLHFKHEFNKLKLKPVSD